MRPVIFLPGILMPAELRYRPLLDVLGPGVTARAKNLEVYSQQPASPGEYSIATELDGIDRLAAALGADRFHLYGHSGGGACCLAYVARSPERVLSLAVDEPASDFSEDDRALIRALEVPLLTKTDEELMKGFVTTQLAPGVTPPPRPDGPPPPWMADRPRGIRAFVAALLSAEVDHDALAHFGAPVYYSHGSLSHPRWISIRDRLARIFPDFASEQYQDLHHLRTSHVAEPTRVAGRLRELWSRGESG